MFRVTYFSTWMEPQHFEGLGEDEKDTLVWEGRNQQFKVVVTMMDESEPENF